MQQHRRRLIQRMKWRYWARLNHPILKRVSFTRAEGKAWGAALYRAAGLLPPVDHKLSTGDNSAD